MATTADLQQRAAALSDEMGAILDLAESETRALTPEEETKYDEKKEQRDGLLSLVERRQAFDASVITVDVSPADLRSALPQTDERDTSTTDQRAVTIEVGADREVERGFADIGDQLRSVANAAFAAKQGFTDQIDKRLLHIETESRALLGQSEKIPGDGGYLVQKNLQAGIWDRVYSGGEVLQRVAQFGVAENANGTKINAIDADSRVNGSRWGGLRGYWLDEGASLTASQTKFRQVELTLHKVGVLNYQTEETLQDAAALSAVVDRMVPDELRFMIEDTIVNGSGVAKPLGFMNSAAKITATATTAQGANTLVAANFREMYRRMHPRSLPNSVWFVHQDTMAQILALPGDSGANVFTPSGNFANAPFGAILGRPIIPIEFAASLGTEGDVIFADLSQYAFITKGGVRADASMHVQFLTDQMAFRWLVRVDGQSLWPAALTPYKGTVTTSPFVTLSSTRS